MLAVCFLRGNSFDIGSQPNVFDDYLIWGMSDG